jgi:hypothetical protein
MNGKAGRLLGMAALSLLVLLALCVAFASLRGVGGGAAPLLAISTVIVFLHFALVADVLPTAGRVLVVAAVLGAALALWRRRAVLAVSLRAPGIWIFTGTAVAALVVFGIRQPVFSFWDEFTFVGPASKLLTLYGRSYAALDTGYFTTLTERPGLPLLSWFVQLFSAGFSEWQTIWASALLQAACACALTAAFGPRQWRVAVPLAAAGLLAPFFFGIGYETVDLAGPWLSVYLDLPAGMLAGAALALYFSLRHRRRGALWQVALPLAAAALIRDNTVPIALVAAGVMAADCLFFGTAGAVSGPARQRLRRWAAPRAICRRVPPALRQTAVRLAAAAAWFGCVLAVYLPWSWHAAWAHAQNVWFDGRQTNMPLGEAAASALRQLTGLAPKTDEMRQVLGHWWANFVGKAAPGGAPGVYSVSMAGSPLVTALCILAVLAAAIALAVGRRQKLRLGLAALLTGGGFAAYHLMLFVYWGVLSHQRGQVISYERHLASYNLAWFLPAATLLALCAVRGGAAPSHPARRPLARAAVLALALVMAARTAAMVRPGYSVFDWPDTRYAGQRQRQATAAALAARLPAGARVFFVSQAPDEEGGIAHLYYWLYMMPVVVDYSLTGGWHFVPPDDPEAPPGTPEAAGVTLREMADYLAEHGLEYILIERLDAGFVDTYGSLFRGALADWPGRPALYVRGGDGLYGRLA